MKKVTRRIIGSILVSIPFIAMIIFSGFSLGWFIALIFWGTVFIAAGLLISGCYFLA
jgi:fatty acid desaturase